MAPNVRKPTTHRSRHPPPSPPARHSGALVLVVDPSDAPGRRSPVRDTVCKWQQQGLLRFLPQHGGLAVEVTPHHGKADPAADFDRAQALLHQAFVELDQARQRHRLSSAVVANFKRLAQAFAEDAGHKDRLCLSVFVDACTVGLERSSGEVDSPTKQLWRKLQTEGLFEVRNPSVLSGLLALPALETPQDLATNLFISYAARDHLQWGDLLRDAAAVEHVWPAADTYRWKRAPTNIVTTPLEQAIEDALAGTSSTTSALFHLSTREVPAEPKPPEPAAPTQGSVSLRTRVREVGQFDLDCTFAGVDAYELAALQRLLSTDLPALVRTARQANASERLTQLLRALAPDDPLAAAQLDVAAQTISARQEFLKHVPVLTSAEVHSRAGFVSDNPSQTALRWRKPGKIFAVTHGGRELYPAFQFDEEGRPRPIIGELLAILRQDEQRDDWDQALWFIGENGWLDGKTPLECLDTDPAAVKKAAQQEVLPSG